MKFEDALDELKQSFNLRKVKEDVYQIRINRFLNEFNYCYLALKNIDGTAYLTDYGDTCDLVDTDEKILKLICQKNNVEFNHYIIECKYNNFDDIKHMLLCFDEVMSTK